MKILATEMLGYNVWINEIESFQTFTGSSPVYEVAGCEQNLTAWLCEGKVSRTHVAMNVYLPSNEEVPR